MEHWAMTTLYGHLMDQVGESTRDAIGAAFGRGESPGLRSVRSD
jgi:hypothetical protein